MRGFTFWCSCGIRRRRRRRSDGRAKEAPKLFFFFSVVAMGPSSLSTRPNRAKDLLLFARLLLSGQIEIGERCWRWWGGAALKSSLDPKVSSSQQKKKRFVLSRTIWFVGLDPTRSPSPPPRCCIIIHNGHVWLGGGVGYIGLPFMCVV